MESELTQNSNLGKVRLGWLGCPHGSADTLRPIKFLCDTMDRNQFATHGLTEPTGAFDKAIDAHDV